MLDSLIVRSSLIALLTTFFCHTTFAETTGTTSKPAEAVVLTSATGGTITSSSGNFLSGPVNAFQNNGSSRLLKQGLPFNIMYTFDEPTKVNSYGIKAGGNYFNSSRGVKTWKIYGSNDYTPAGATDSTSESAANEAATWVELDSRTNETGWSSGDYRFYLFDNAVPYKTYKIEVANNNGDANKYSQWLYMEYCYLPQEFLVVAGYPLEINEVTPNFGKHEMPSGATTFTSSESAVAEDGKSRTVCSGWKVYTLNDDGITWVEDPSKAGSGTTFTWDTMPTVTTKVEWQYATEHHVAATSHPFGTVQVSSEWVNHNSEVVVTAAPQEGYTFVRWDGDVPAGQITQNPLTLSVDRGLEIQALFLPVGATEYVQYLSPTGDDANNGFTPETAKRTIAAAVSFFKLTPSVPGKLYLLPGQYHSGAADNKSPMIVDIPLTITGYQATKETAIVDCAFEQKNKTIGFYLNHPQACLRGLTVTNAQCQSSTYAASVTVGPAGGLIEDCIIANGHGYSYASRSGGVRLEAGRMNRCFVVRCGVGDENAYGGNKGQLLEITGDAIAENCSLSEGYTSHGPANKRASAIYMWGGTLRNCTIFNNKANLVGGVYAATGAKVINCALFDNVTNMPEGQEATDVEWAGDAAAFSYCATDNATPINDTCIIGTTTDAFTDYPAGNITPAKDGILCNAGVIYDGLAPTDLAGRRRLVGRTVDIGCYEVQGSVGMMILFR